MRFLQQFKGTGDGISVRDRRWPRGQEQFFNRPTCSACEKRICAWILGSGDLFIKTCLPSPSKLAWAYWCMPTRQAHLSHYKARPPPRAMRAAVLTVSPKTRYLGFRRGRESGRKRYILLGCRGTWGARRYDAHTLLGTGEQAGVGLEVRVHMPTSYTSTHRGSLTPTTPPMTGPQWMPMSA